MRNHLREVVLAVLFTTSCAAPDDAEIHTGVDTRAVEHASVAANPLTEQDCIDYLQEPFGANCDEPVNEDSCQRVWDTTSQQTRDYGCFGFKEELNTCRNCNKLFIGDYTYCKNKQYMDCFLAGYLQNLGPLCFVTPPEEVDFNPADPRVTAFEICYYYHQTGIWPPPQCPSATQCCGCTGGTDYLGNPVSAFCEEQVCGADFQFYTCTPSEQWSPTGEGCPTCQCTGGTDYLGNPVSVSCGESVCGADFQTYDCVQGSWVSTGNSCP